MPTSKTAAAILAAAGLALALCAAQPARDAAPAPVRAEADGAASAPAAERPVTDPPTIRPIAPQPASAIEFEIARWPRLATGVLSLTFDDGVEKLFSVTEPQLTARGIRGTFFICTGWIGQPKYGSWDQVRAAAAHGHEIGSHSVSHGYKEGDEPALAGSRDTIDREVPGRRCVSISYPSGGFNRRAGEFYVTGRMAGKHWFYPEYPDRLIRVEDYIMGRPDADQMHTLAAEAVAKAAWAVVTFHYPGDEFGAALAGLDGFGDRLAVLPMGEVARYIREAQSVTIELVGRDASSIRLKVADGLADEVYDRPLALLVPLPAGWDGFEATQAGKPVWHEVRGGRMAFEAVPDAGKVVLKKRRP